LRTPARRSGPARGQPGTACLRPVAGWTRPADHRSRPWPGAAAKDWGRGTPSPWPDPAWWPLSRMARAPPGRWSMTRARDIRSSSAKVRSVRPGWSNCRLAHSAAPRCVPATSRRQDRTGKL